MISLGVFIISLVQVQNSSRERDRSHGWSTTEQSCQDFYIGETERSLWTRFKEHRRPSSVSVSEVSKHLHVDTRGHSVNFKDTKVLDQEQRWLERGIKEAVYIRAHKPTLNASPGRYILPTVWNRVISLHAHPSM